MRWNIRQHWRGDPRALNRLFWLSDPWHLRSPGEHHRYRETASVIRSRVGSRFASMLEVGCAEGQQTRYLSPMAHSLVGIDISDAAIRRAKRLGLPNADFRVSDLFSFADRNRQAFDLVVACEVLYYFADVAAALDAVNRLGRTVVVSFYVPAPRHGVPRASSAASVAQLERAFSGSTYAGRALCKHTIEHAGQCWRIVWWETGPLNGRAHPDV
jgi:SAM-dependent methyltransferase